MSSPSVMTLQMPRTTTCLRLLLPFVQRALLSSMTVPRTAPLTNPRSGFDPKPKATLTPERMREHARFPSEGVFNPSMDEDSSFFSLSDASGELKAKADFLVAALVWQPSLRTCRLSQRFSLPKVTQPKGQRVTHFRAVLHLLQLKKNPLLYTAHVPTNTEAVI